MRKLTLQMSMSVDGFVAGPLGELDWLFANPDPSAEASTLKNAQQAGAHVMGSRTFRDMAGWWPSSTEAVAPAMNGLPKIVFSKNPDITSKSGWTSVETTVDATKLTGSPPPRAAATVATANEKSWHEARVMSGDLAEDIAQLKSEPGNDLIAWGGAGFGRSLVTAGLIDSLVLTVYPVALGHGLSIFNGLNQRVALKLESGTPLPGGAVSYVYSVVSTT